MHSSLGHFPVIFSPSLKNNRSFPSPPLDFVSLSVPLPRTMDPTVDLPTDEVVPPPVDGVNVEQQPDVSFDDDDVHSANEVNGDNGDDAAFDDRQVQDLIEQQSTASRASVFTRIGGSITSAIKLSAAAFVRATSSRRTLVPPGHFKTYDVDSKTFNILISAPELTITNIVQNHPSKKLKSRKDLKKYRKAANHEEKKLRTMQDEKRDLEAKLAEKNAEIKSQSSTVKRANATVEWEEQMQEQLEVELAIATDIANDDVPFYANCNCSEVQEAIGAVTDAEWKTKKLSQLSGIARELNRCHWFDSPYAPPEVRANREVFESRRRFGSNNRELESVPSYMKYLLAVVRWNSGDRSIPPPTHAPLPSHVPPPDVAPQVHGQGDVPPPPPPPPPAPPTVDLEAVVEDAYNNNANLYMAMVQSNDPLQQAAVASFLSKKRARMDVIEEGNENGVDGGDEGRPPPPKRQRSNNDAPTVQDG